MAQRGASSGRWPAVVAAGTATLWPITTIRRTLHAGLAGAALVHVVGVALLVAVGVALTAWSEAPLPLTTSAWWHEVQRIGVEATSAARADWKMALWFLTAALTLEAGVVVAAWLGMAWGAQPETPAGAFARSLKRLWLLTPHAAVLIAAVGTAEMSLARAERAASERWHEQGVVMPSPPSPRATPEAIAAYQAQSDAWWAAWEAHLAARPWWLQHAALLTWGAWWLAWGWALVVLLRAQGAGAWGARCRWPAVCEGCGYVLTGLLSPMRPERSCPECGWRLAASVGPYVRSGVAWQKPWRHERVKAWWGAVVDPVRRPTGFGRQLRALAPERAHRRLLVWHALAVLALGPVGMAAIYLLDFGGLGWQDVADVLAAGLTAGQMTVWLLVLVTVGAASVVGASATRAAGFPLMPVAIQATCHLSGLAVAWMAVTWALVLAFTAAERLGLLEQAAALVGVRHGDMLAPWAFLGVQVVGLALYGILLRRIVLAARFANW